MATFYIRFIAAPKMVTLASKSTAPLSEIFIYFELNLDLIMIFSLKTAKFKQFELVGVYRFNNHTECWPYAFSLKKK